MYVQVCDRIETRRTRKSIESEIGKFRRRIQQEEPHTAEREKVVKDYTDKVELYQKTMEAIRSHRTALKVHRLWCTFQIYELWALTLEYSILSSMEKLSSLWGLNWV